MVLADVSTPQESEKAAHGGAGICFFVAAVTSIIASISVYTGKSVIGLDAWAFVDAAVFAFAGWRIWKMSRTWAVVALALYVCESVVRLAGSPKPASGLVMTVIFVLALIAGVRGTFAHHRLAKNEAEQAKAATVGRTN